MVDQRLKDDNDESPEPEARTIPSVPEPEVSPPSGAILWTSSGPPPAGVGDQDGTEYEKDGDYLESSEPEDLEKHRLTLPMFLRAGYAILPPMLMKKPGASVSRTNATYLANQIVDCAYQDDDLRSALEGMPDDCKMAIAGEAFRIYGESPKIGDKNERETESYGSTGRPGGSAGVPMGAEHGRGGSTGGHHPPGQGGGKFDIKSPEARAWGIGGLWS